jgi:rhodanese-related sulfurtransferase
MRNDMFQLNDSVLANPTNYVFVHQWGSAVMNAGLQFSGLLHDQITGTQRYTAWARGQTDYLMGANPINRNYVTGFAENSVKHTHHSGASGYSTQPGRNETRPQMNLLIGALAGGPINAQGVHNDVEDDYIGNEVGITYNAPFIGAVAGLYLAATPAERATMTIDSAIPTVKPTHIFPRTPLVCGNCGTCEICTPSVIGCGDCGTCGECTTPTQIRTVERLSLPELCEVCLVEKLWRVTRVSADGEVIEERRGAKFDTSGKLLDPCKPSSVEYVKITAAEAQEIMSNQSHVLLDVRRQDEFDELHIEGATLIPYDEIGVRASGELSDRNALILIYCRSGRRSEIAARELIALGYRNVFDFGGIIDFF